MISFDFCKTLIKKSTKIFVERKNVLVLPLEKSPGGEIGRHTSLRGWRLHGCASSSLVLGTVEMKALIIKFVRAFLF